MGIKYTKDYFQLSYSTGEVYFYQTEADNVWSIELVPTDISDEDWENGRYSGYLNVDKLLNNEYTNYEVASFCGELPEDLKGEEYKNIIARAEEEFTEIRKECCDVCGTILEENEARYELEDGRVMDEECYIQHLAKQKGLVVD